MGNLTVGDLRKFIEGVPDDVPVLCPSSDHSYSQCWRSGTGYSTALDDGDGYTEDIFIPEIGEGVGEETEYGTRIRAFIIQ